MALEHKLNIEIHEMHSDKGSNQHFIRKDIKKKEYLSTATLRYNSQKTLFEAIKKVVSKLKKDRKLKRGDLVGYVLEGDRYQYEPSPGESKYKLKDVIFYRIK